MNRDRFPVSETRSAKVFDEQNALHYFDVGLGAISLAGADTGGAYCLLDLKSPIDKARFSYN